MNFLAVGCCRMLGACFAAGCLLCSVLAAGVSTKEFTARDVARAPAGSRHLVATETTEGMRFYAAAGSEVFSSKPGSAPVRVAAFSQSVHQMLPVPMPRPGELFVLTEAGAGYILSVSAAPVIVTPPDMPPLSLVAFTTMPLYGKKPHALVLDRGAVSVNRLAWGPPRGGAPAASLAVEERLGLAPRDVVWLGFCDVPAAMGLLAVRSGGDFWWIDSAGRAAPYLSTRSFAGASCAVSDVFGLFGGTMLVGVPARGEVWQLAADRKTRRLVSGLDEFSGGVPAPSALSLGPDGGLYLLAGERIVAVGPPPDSPLAESARTMREARKRFSSGAWGEAEELADAALKDVKGPKPWVLGVKELKVAARGAVVLDRLRRTAEKAGHAGLVAEAQKLERVFQGNPYLASEIANFRKRCETERDTVIVADFEEDPVMTPGIPAASIEPGGSSVRRAARPDPVKEGTYSLKWSVPSGAAGSARLAFRVPQWGHSDDIATISLWVYSSRDRYNADLVMMSSADVELARYTVSLRKGWQEFRRPPVYRPRQELPASLILSAIVIEIRSQAANEIYVDDVRLIGRLARRSTPFPKGQPRR